MSYTIWHDYGYGINTDKIETTFDKILDFVCLAPNYKKVFEEYMKHDIEELKKLNLTMNDFEEMLYNADSPLSSIIASVIYELEDITLTVCSEYDISNFCLFSPKYIWKMTNNERALTEDGVKQLFAKYVAHLTNQTLEDLDYGYQEVENGG